MELLVKSTLIDRYATRRIHIDPVGLLAHNMKLDSTLYLPDCPEVHEFLGEALIDNLTLPTYRILTINKFITLDMQDYYADNTLYFVCPQGLELVADVYYRELRYHILFTRGISKEKRKLCIL